MDDREGSPAGEEAQSAPGASAGERLADTLSKLSGAPVGSEALVQAFEAMGADSSEDEAEVLDEYEKLDFSDLFPNRPQLREQVAAFLARQLSPQRVLLRDKLTFLCFTLSSFLASYWLGASPTTFWRYYAAGAPALFVLRLVLYRWRRWHYYLWDLCYYANALLLLQLWAFPASITLAKVNFAFASGPLAWSVVAFRNSLVYHSLDRMTSHFMHWTPAMVAWASRWHPPEPLRAAAAASPAATAQWEAGGGWQLVGLPMLAYLLWAILYYLKIFVVSSERIQQRGYETLFQYATRSRGSLFGAVVWRFPRAWQPPAYMALHLALTAATLGLVMVWWRWQQAHTAFLICIFAASAWSGASFYFDVFAHRYLASVGLEQRSGRRGTSASPSATAGVAPSQQQQQQQQVDGAASSVKKRS